MKRIDGTNPINGLLAINHVSSKTQRVTALTGADRCACAAIRLSEFSKTTVDD